MPLFRFDTTHSSIYATVYRLLAYVKQLANIGQCVGLIADRNGATVVHTEP